MTLIDTSVWVAHLKQRGGHPEVIAALTHDCDLVTADGPQLKLHRELRATRSP